MKRILLGLLIFGLAVSGIQAREHITPEEKATVSKLTDWGVLEKVRTTTELNEPLTAIDTMSMQIKAIKTQSEWFNSWANANFQDLNRQNEGLQNEINDFKAESYIVHKAIAKKIDDNFWTNVGISIVSLVVGLIL